MMAGFCLSGSSLNRLSNSSGNDPTRLGRMKSQVEIAINKV
jgi:hypothetical protein